jgi:hypothetical protein
MTELYKWLRKNGACAPGVKWVIENRIKTFREGYDKGYPDDLVWYVTREGVMTRRQRVAFALYCVKQVSYLLTDTESLAVIPALEKWLAGKVTQEEMHRVYKCADAVAYDDSEFFDKYPEHRAAAKVASCAAKTTVYGCNLAYIATCASAACKSINSTLYQSLWIKRHLPFDSLNFPGE